jgi:hypothetical protein
MEAFCNYEGYSTAMQERIKLWDTVKLGKLPLEALPINAYGRMDTVKSAVLIIVGKGSHWTPS